MIANQSQRTNVILLGVLGLLGAGAALKAFVFKSKYETNETVRAATPLFENFKKDEIGTIVIEGPEEKKVELVKDGDHWNVADDGNFRADKADVDRVLSGIEKLKQGKEMSTQVDNLDRFNLQKGKGIVVTAWGSGGKNGKPVANFTIGKAGDEWKFAFVRVTDEKAIRKVEGSTADFEAGYDNTWRDKTIYDHGDAAKVEEITITGPKGQVALVRKKEMGPKEDKNGKSDAAGGDAAVKSDGDAKSGADGDATSATDGEKKKPDQEVKETYWELTVPTEGRAKKWLADNIATHVGKLECDSFFTGTEKASELGLDPPAYVATARREGETEATPILLIGNKSKDGKYPVKMPKGDTIWWIASWKGDYLTKSADELLETPPAKPEDKKAAAPAGDATANGDAKPADAAAPPTDGDAKPVDSNAKPADDGDKGAKPAGDGAKPVDDGTKPADHGEKGAKPADGGEKPADDGAAPADGAKKSDGGGN